MAKIKYEEDYIHGLTLADERDREAARLRDSPIVGRSLGQANGTVPPERQQHPVPGGCQWARDCGECPWPDCVIPDGREPLPYGSKAAEKARRNDRMVHAFAEEGVPTRELARRFGMSQRTARRKVALYGGAPRWVERTRNAAVLRLTQEGASISQSARRFGVSERTISRIRARNGRSDETGPKLGELAKAIGQIQNLAPRVGLEPTT